LLYVVNTGVETKGSEEGTRDSKCCGAKHHNTLSHDPQLIQVYKP